MRRSVTAVVVGVALLAGTAESSASTIDECQGLIEAVSAALAGVEIGGGNPDRTRASLESKLDGAITKLDEGKIDDALQKLAEFQDKIQELAGARKPKMDSDDADHLTALAEAAIECIEGL